MSRSRIETSIFNQLFTGSEFTITKAPNQPFEHLSAQDFDQRHFYINKYKDLGEQIKAIQGIKITLVEDGTKWLLLVLKISARAGEGKRLGEFHTWERFSRYCCD